MNADFASAFHGRCHGIRVIYDLFHLIRKMNEKVISAVRSDGQNRLIVWGRKDEAARLRRNKYILTSLREPLQEKDAKNAVAIAEGKEDLTLARRGSYIVESLRTQYTPRTSHEETCKPLIAGNRMLTACDVLKETVSDAFNARSVYEMRSSLQEGHQLQTVQGQAF